MGAQGMNRLESYRKRFREWEDPTGLQNKILFLIDLLKTFHLGMDFVRLKVC